MKVRNGFVSNSSTSSFVCDVCGEVEADRDLCISDAGMVQCKNGHTFHYPICDKDVAARVKVPEDIDYDNYEFPEEYCPICQMAHIPAGDTLAYILKKNNLDVKTIHDEMRKEKGK